MPLRTPLEAKTLLTNLKNDEKREASMLEEALSVAQSCSILVSGKIAKLAKPDLAKHLALMKNEGVNLPFDIRCQVLTRRVNDLLSELIEAPSKEAGEKIVQSASDALALWDSSGSTLDEAHITANAIFSSAWQSVSVQLVKGVISSADAEEERDHIAKDRLAAASGLVQSEKRYY